MKTKTKFALALLLIVLATSAIGQDACPCVPVSHVWTVTSCETWNCAASAVVLANGDPYTFSLPTASTQRPWIVMKRIVAGTATDSGSDSYQVEAFDNMSAASARFGAITTDYHPMMMSTPDGMTLVASLRSAEPKQRAVKR